MEPRTVEASATGPLKGLRRSAAMVLVAAWLGATAWMFWKVETTGLAAVFAGGPATDGLAIFDASLLDGSVTVAVGMTSGPMSKATVVHFRDPACPCTRAADEHFGDLAKRHGGDGVVFAVADVPGSSAMPIRGLEHLPRLPAADAERLWRDLPSAPAVAVFDAGGRPVYLGPYADMARCGASRGGAAEAALTAALEARGAVPIPLLATGCFCKQPGGEDRSLHRQVALRQDPNENLR